MLNYANTADNQYLINKFLKVADVHSDVMNDILEAETSNEVYYLRGFFSEKKCRLTSYLHQHPYADKSIVAAYNDAINALEYVLA